MSNENPTPLGGSMVMAAVWALLAGAVSVLAIPYLVIPHVYVTGITLSVWAICSIFAFWMALKGAAIAQADEMHRAGTQAGLIALGLMAFMPSSGDLAVLILFYLMSIAMVMLWTYMSHFRAATKHQRTEKRGNRPRR